LIELGTHAVFDARMDGYAAAETMLIEEMFSSLRPGMLVLADRHIYSFHRWIKGMDTGADLLWRVTANLILRPVELLADGSYIAEVNPPKKCGRVSFRLRAIEYRIPGSENRSISPLKHDSDHYLLLLAEVIDELNPERKDRSYPRVVKRKMSNFPVKTARHRQRRQDSRPSQSAVAITPPSKTGHRRRPAKTT
jgi:hypothetical protein